MNTSQYIGLFVAIGLFVYFLIAMLRPAAIRSAWRQVPCRSISMQRIEEWCVKRTKIDDHDLGQVRGVVRVLGPIPELARSWRLLTHPDLRRTPRVAAFFDFIIAEREALKIDLDRIAQVSLCHLGRHSILLVGLARSLLRIGKSLLMLFVVRA